MSKDANLLENPHAGQGSSVLLDIGGDIGALVIEMPAELEGLEIELRPTGRAVPHEPEDAKGHSNDELDHGHHSGHHDGHHHGLPHVAVVPRPTPEGDTVHSVVFYEVSEGRYELYVRPDGPVQLTVDVSGGKVTYATWPR